MASSVEKLNSICKNFFQHLKYHFGNKNFSLYMMCKRERDIYMCVQDVYVCIEIL
jgi:hypothetical protein